MTDPARRDDPPPVPPTPPSSEDCCRSGCHPCVFDLYREELERYREALAAWERKNSAKKTGKAGSRKAG